jgi:acetyl esterase
MPRHPDAQKFLDIVAGAPPLDTQTPEQNRADLIGALPLIGEKAEMASVTDATLAGVPVRVYAPSHTDQAQPAVVYLHGGGWVLGDLEIADSTCRAVALNAQAVVISVDYRRAPEVVFPGALEDTLAVTQVVLTGQAPWNIDETLVAIAGDSAGGNLAAVTAQQLRHHTPSLVHQVLIYPVTDLGVNATEDSGSYGEYAEGHFLTARDLEYFYSLYAAGTDRSDERLSPARQQDLSDLPSATVITAECDPLRDQGEKYGRAMMEAGTQVTTVRFQGQVHPFLYMGGIIEDAHAARRFIGAQLKAAFAAATQGRASSTADDS